MITIPSTRLILAVLPDHPGASESVVFQLTGLLVVFFALGSIWALLELSGAFFRRADGRRGTTVADSAPLAPPVSSAPSPGPELTRVLITATVDSLFDGRARIISADSTDPDVIRAIIAATVHCMFDGRARIVSVETLQTDTAWAREGRRDIFSSHRIR